MMKRKRSERASARPRRPSPESNDTQQRPGTSNSTGQGPNSTAEDCMAFVQEMVEHFKDIDPSKSKAFVNLLQAQKRGGVGDPCVISQAKELFRGHTELLKQFNEVLRPYFKILFKEDVPETQDLAKLYVAKVKARSSSAVYTTFVHILFLFDERALTVDEVDREVEVLFAKSCDLLEEYDDCFRPDRAPPVVQSPLHPRHSDLEVSELQRQQQSERIQRMCENVAKRKRKEKGKGAVTEQNRQPPPKRVISRLANAANAVGNRRSSRPTGEAHPRRPPRSSIATPATETQGRSHRRGYENAVNSGRSMCTPSYLMLKPPKNGDSNGNGDGEGEDQGKGEEEDEEEEKGDGEDEVSVHRSELAKSVLNEECEMVVQEKDFKQRTCNPHEEVLFTCEMDQYECDMITKRLEATMKSFMNYLLKLQEPNIGELPPMEEFLLAVHERCIQQLYDSDNNDDAKTFIEALKENPRQVLPILINRIMLKLEELKSKKAMITPMWSQVYKKNFHLSLEHQP